MAALADWDIQSYTMERFAEEGFAPLGRPAREFYGPIFGGVQAMIFVSSVGLAVREVAPHLKKQGDRPRGARARRAGAVCDPRALGPYRRGERAGQSACRLARRAGGHHNGDRHQRPLLRGRVGGAEWLRHREPAAREGRVRRRARGGRAVSQRLSGRDGSAARARAGRCRRARRYHRRL